MGVGGWVMTHQTLDMAGVQDPAKGFGHSICRVDSSWDVKEDDGIVGFPVLDGKPLDINVATALGGNTMVDHVDG